MAEDLLPNCLTRTPKPVFEHSGWLYVFCANCGANGGRVMATGLPAEYAFYLCNDCAEKYGEPYGFTATPDDVFRAKVQQAMVEEYGHVLTESEILMKLDDKYSVISQLEKEAKRR